MTNATTFGIGVCRGCGADYAPTHEDDDLCAACRQPVARSDTGRWLDLERRRRQLEAELKTLVTQQDALRQRILERWSMDGTTKETVDGYSIGMRRSLYPKVADKGRLAMALRKEGLEDLLTVDEKAFGLYITACDENGTPLPDSIAEHVPDRFERFALVVRLPGRLH